MNKKVFSLLVSVGAVLICSLLIFTNLDNKIADYFQRPLETTKEDPKVVMLNIDDATVSEVGVYPIRRDYYGKALFILKELGAQSVLFDINFLEESPNTIDDEYVSDKLEPEIVDDLMQMADGNVDFDESKENVMADVSKIFMSPDQVFAGGIKFAQNTYLSTVFKNNAQSASESMDELLKNKFAIKNIKATNDTKTPVQNSVEACIEMFTDNAVGVGSVNGAPDSDAYLRRIHLFHKYKGDYYGQLIMAPILKRYGNPDIEISDDYIKLIGAKISGTETKDIVIPRGEDGAVIVKFPKKVYDEYNAISFWNVLRLDKLEDEIILFVKQLEESNYLQGWKKESLSALVDEFQAIPKRFSEYEETENDTFENYRAIKNEFYSLLKEYLDDEDFIANAIALNCQSEEEISQAISFFDNLRTYYGDYVDSFAKLSNKLDGAICTVGVLATGTTDIGVNQYEKFYPNTGVHYSLMNQILAQDFVDDSNPLYGILLALLLCVVYSQISNVIKGTGRQIILGIGMITLSFAGLLGYFIMTRVYIVTSVPIISLSLDFVFTTVAGFIAASKDKKFITNAFSQCLSKEVVKEIVANPASFKLGGQKLEMTAIFTDIQKFSSFSELLTASQLVALLNYYLTKMSDIIMDERGTVDKYEGDAIIALVGAPVKMIDHAQHAVRAALKMKAAEVVMNQDIKEIASAPKPEYMDEELYSAFTIMVQNHKSIFTRIGLNSGEMIAGYMGSENKKNYTMMGNNVNLASRLEGVNKQYSTGGILISEATRKLLGDRFIVRRLDRVRVVNVNTPIRLYEPLSERGVASEKLLRFVDDWEEAMDRFENGEYETALDMFKKMAETRPNDGVAKYYINMISSFFVKGKFPVEADNVGVEYIPEDKVFKLLQK